MGDLNLTMEGDFDMDTLKKMAELQILLSLTNNQTFLD